MRDRLRLKDATHVLASIAVPSALALVAQRETSCCCYWMDEVTAPANAGSNRVWEKFVAQRDLAHKILLDICVDSDSEIITQINVLAADGDEAADALELIRLEEAADGQCCHEHRTSGAFVVRADRSRTLPDMRHWR